jgi:hypothetical protein
MRWDEHGQIQNAILFRSDQFLAVYDEDRPISGVDHLQIRD